MCLTRIEPGFLSWDPHCSLLERSENWLRSVYSLEISCIIRIITWLLRWHRQAFEWLGSWLAPLSSCYHLSFNATIRLSRFSCSFRLSHFLNFFFFKLRVKIKGRAPVFDSPDRFLIPYWVLCPGVMNKILCYNTQTSLLWICLLCSVLAGSHNLPVDEVTRSCLNPYSVWILDSRPYG